MINRKVLFNFVMSLTLAASVIAATWQSASGDVRTQTKVVKAMPGSWSVNGDTAAQGEFKALITFNSDGTMIADEPSAFETAGHGTWIFKGGSEVGYTFIVLIGSPSNEFSGTIKVVGTLRLAGGDNIWSGPFKVEVKDPGGNVVFSDTGTLTGTRIQVEPLD
ncbi:MAG: hypothetical protein V7641_4310 [Blastocatellia bacterium]